jgi:hypothetical protein
MAAEVNFYRQKEQNILQKPVALNAVVVNC